MNENCRGIAHRLLDSWQSVKQNGGVYSVMIEVPEDSEFALESYCPNVILFLIGSSPHEFPSLL